VWDYRKAERALAQLENREVEPQAPEGEDKEKGAEEEEDVITEEVVNFTLFLVLCWSHCLGSQTHRPNVIVLCVMIYKT
jgi:hypothetical protein